MKKVNILRRYKGEPDGIYRQLLLNQSLSPENLEVFNFNQFKCIFTRAFEQCDFYHRKYSEAGITPSDIRSSDDIQKVPLLTREEIKNNVEDMVCRDVKRKSIFKVGTGGSTGTPLRFYHEKAEPYLNISFRTLSWWGLNPEDNVASVIRRADTSVNRVKSLIWDWPKKRVFLNAMMISPKSMEEFIELAKKYDIQYIWGYEGGIYQLATYVHENKISLPLKAVITTSAPLPKPHRLFISKVFKAQVFDQYGSCEIHFLAAECQKHEGLHILSDLHRVEFVDDSDNNVPDGEYGDIVVTDFVNKSFPFIRYKNGDVGRKLLHTCSCGMPFPLMDAVKGRTSDMIVFSDGSCIAGDYLTTIFDAYADSVQAFQVFQKLDGTVILRVVPTGIFQGDANIDAVFNGLKNLIGTRSNVLLERVSQIEHDHGKFRFILREKE
ncbi:MAG: phenylacetate--CoA ligase family protein [Victivallaceae bacterium]